jgi:hypothetical protein
MDYRLTDMLRHGRLFSAVQKIGKRHAAALAERERAHTRLEELKRVAGDLAYPGGAAADTTAGEVNGEIIGLHAVLTRLESVETELRQELFAAVDSNRERWLGETWKRVDTERAAFTAAVEAAAAAYQRLSEQVDAVRWLLAMPNPPRHQKSWPTSLPKSHADNSRYTLEEVLGALADAFDGLNREEWEARREAGQARSVGVFGQGPQRHGSRGEHPVLGGRMPLVSQAIEQ